MTSQKLIYETPVVETYEYISEGILCTSGNDSDFDLIPEEGNM